MGLFSMGKESPLGDRLSKEQATQTLLGDEDIDVTKVDDDKLNSLISNLATVTVESFEATVSELIGVMREMNSSDADIKEALKEYLHVHASEAQEIFQEYTTSSPRIN